MELLRPVTEAKVVAEFLRAELASDRWSDRIRGLLEDDGARDEPLASTTSARTGAARGCSSAIALRPDRGVGALLS